MAESSNRPQAQPQLTWINLIATLALMATMAGGAWILFQAQFANLETQLRAADANNGAELKSLRSALEQLRDHSVLRDELVEFVKRLDEGLAFLQKRLDVLESTRPTTGELQNRAAALKSEIDELKDRIKWLEQQRPQQR